MMYTDPEHLRLQDPGHIEGNTVFTYLDAFANDDLFKEYLPEYSCLSEMKDHYKKGGLGDMKCKKFLVNVLEETLAPLREKRHEWENKIPEVYEILRSGTEHAAKEADRTLQEVRAAMRIDYFSDQSIVSEWENFIK